MDLASLLPTDSWFKKFLLLWPTIECPQTYQLFSGMSAMGAALGRKFWFDNDIFQVYPMLNLLLIGPSGIGKSTAINYLSLPLVKSLRPEYQPQIIISGTKEKIHEDLVGGPKAILVASELANFFSRVKYMEGLIPYVTQLLDYEDEVVSNTLSRSKTVVRSPEVTIMGGSTVEWLQEQLPDSAGTGGFLARFLIIAEEFKSQRVALPGLHLDPTARAELDARRNRVFYEFGQLIASAPSGKFKMRDYEVADVFSYWYVNQKPSIGHLAPFVERSREFVLRLAMLIALSCKRTYIDVGDIRSAIALHEVATRKLASVIVPVSADGKLLADVLKAIGKGEMTYKQLYLAMASIAAAPRIDALVESHIRSGALITTPDKKLRRARN